MSTLRTALRPHWGWPLRVGLALSGWLALAVTGALPDAAVLRVLITTAFLVPAPGLAAVRWVRPAARGERGRPVVLEAAFLALILSMCLALLTVEPFYLSGSFTTTRALAVLAVVTSALALLPVPARARHRAVPVVEEGASAGPATDPPSGPAADGAEATLEAVPGIRSAPTRGPAPRSRGRSAGRLPVAVVGAGPYGLATACHLRAARMPMRIFGEVMESWRVHMPQGMFLRTTAAASAIAAPERGHTFADFRTAQGMPPADDRRPVPLAEYVDYGRWFQERLVPELEPSRVRRIQPADGGFGLLLDSGEELLAASVVLATGAVPFAYVPRELHECVKAGMASHTSAHPDLSALAGLRVAVLGAGQSALESATLLHEVGAHPTLIARSATVVFESPPPPDGTSGHPRPAQQPLKPDSPLGRGWLRLACHHGGAAYRRLPAPARLHLLRTVPKPSGAWWLRERAQGRFPVLCGRTLLSALPRGGTVRLRLTDAHGRSETLVADHVLAATGYRVNVHRLGMLEPGLGQAVRTFAGAPLLSSGLESSVPGLYFTGLAAGPTFGPSLRFVSGTGFAARRLTGAVVARNTERP
ncbi:FAD-dependent oxidoreductase [Streptomyces sp. NPDC018693]|uniref:FAD-dependent oxidoreductase n=1 Tax=unclassified Streptomyces TaxID=2593676 RepID=UPI0037BCC28E